MTSVSISLEPQFRDLEACVRDFSVAHHRQSVGVLRHLVYVLDEPPLATFLEAVLPRVDFQEWIAQNKNVSGNYGGGVLNWPAPRAERVALQTGLCRAIASGDLNFLGFIHEYFYTGPQIDGIIQRFTETLLWPLARDIRRLAEQRPVDAVLSTLLGSVENTGDAVLDGLLKDSVAKFKDPSPKQRLEATQVLWDAWERLKSLADPDDKQKSAKQLLDRASSDVNMRAVLESEARELTKIGNQFHIRHFEANKTAIENPDHVEYLFHRMYAFVQMLLKARG